MAFSVERVAWRGAPAALYLGIIGVGSWTRGAQLDGVGYLVLATLIAIQASLGQGPTFHGWRRVPIVVIIGLAVVAWLMWPVVAIRIAGLLVLVVVQVWGIVRSMKV